MKVEDLKSVVSTSSSELIWVETDETSFPVDSVECLLPQYANADVIKIEGCRGINYTQVVKREIQRPAMSIRISEGAVPKTNDALKTDMKIFGVCVKGAYDGYGMSDYIVIAESKEEAKEMLMSDPEADCPKCDDDIFEIPFVKGYTLVGTLDA